MKPLLLTVLGPTACGKTSLAVKIAYKFNGEIISADSRQVYRRMDIGTGKDLNEYQLDGKKINYHGIDVVNPREEFNVYNFQKLFVVAFEKIISSGRMPVMAGGTGLYLSSILQKYKFKEMDFARKALYKDKSINELRAILTRLNPSLHNTTDLIEKERVIDAILVAESKGEEIKLPEFKSIVLGVKFEREEIKSRITKRLKQRLNSGMIDEVERLISEGVTYERLKLFGLEYKFISSYLAGELNYNDMYQKLNSAIHSFAKRQMTWFRKMEKEGVKIHWIEKNNFDQAAKLISPEIQTV